MKNITAKRSRARIVDKLLALGLVAERRELYKKRRKKLAPSGLVIISPWLCWQGTIPPEALLRSSSPRIFVLQAVLIRSTQNQRTPLSSLFCLLFLFSIPFEFKPNGEESLKDTCQEDLEEEENLSEEESEESEEKEEGSEAEQTPQGSTDLSAENLGQSLHQEGGGLGRETCLRWKRGFSVWANVKCSPSLRLFGSSPMAPELPDSSSR